MQDLARAGWRVMITPTHPAIPGGMRFAIDNGAWSAYQSGKPFDSSAFMALAKRLGSSADFVVLPDIVAGGSHSLEFSISWLPKLRDIKTMLLLPLQDGMSFHEVGMALRQNVRLGLFLGGSTDYKLREMYAWGAVAAAWKRPYHVARVNSMRRVRLCAEAGATSFDGSGATRFANNLPRLDAALLQPSLLVPSKEALC